MKVFSHQDYPCHLKHPVGKQSWELKHSDIECTKKLGEGAFGEVSLPFPSLYLLSCQVHKGTWAGLPAGKSVAIKLAKLDSLTKEQIKDIMREVRGGEREEVREGEYRLEL